MEIAIRHKTYWRGLRAARAAGLRVRKSVPRRRGQRTAEPINHCGPAVSRIRRGIRHSALIPANHRNRLRSCVSTSPADKLRLTTLPSLSTSSIVGRVRIPRALTSGLSSPPGSYNCGQRDRVLLQVGLEGGASRVDVDTQQCDVFRAVLGLHILQQGEVLKGGSRTTWPNNGSAGLCRETTRCSPCFPGYPCPRASDG